MTSRMAYSISLARFSYFDGHCLVTCTQTVTLRLKINVPHLCGVKLGGVASIWLQKILFRMGL